MKRTYELQALTDIWTGDANTAKSKQAQRLIPTGLLGSIRWWFEVLVRGLGGRPCAPSSDQKVCLDDDHCVVCELFGCTGWARKFRFDIRDAGGAVIRLQLVRNSTFQLCFTPLRAVTAEEWTLLELTLRLISEFGALGGKTTLKPSAQNGRPQHADFGLVKLASTSTTTIPRQRLTNHVVRWAKKPIVNEADWASCRNMWFVEGMYLTRNDQNTSTFNRVIERPEPKATSSQGDSWIAGRRGQRRDSERSAVEPESKKVFSFRQPPRTFGFMRQAADFTGMREKLQAIWGLPAIPADWFLAGEAILGRLFGNEGAS